MKVFDSTKNKSWSGKGLSIRNNSIIVLKSADFYHNISLREGSYTVKILGKKRTGKGLFNLEILDSKNSLIFQKEIDFTNSSWSESKANFSIPKNLGPGKLRISRNRSVYGSIELGRIVVELEQKQKTEPESKVVSRARARINNSLNIQQPKIFNQSISLANSKIAFIVPYHIYGGAEVYIENIINEMSSSQQITMLYMKANKLQNKIRHKNIINRVIKNPSQLRGILKSNNFDFIIYYNRADIYGLISQMKATKEIRSKLVEIYHSDFTWSGALSLIKERKHVDRFITVSRSLGNDIAGVSEVKKVIPVGVDLSRFKPGNSIDLKKRLGIDLNKKVIGTVARLSKEKNIDYIVSLAKLLPNFEFVIVGDGPEKSRLIALSSKLKNINFIGHVDDTSDYYKIFDAFVLASRIEGTPISIIEAMASGTLVFSNMVGAIPDIITDGVTGFSISNKPNEAAGIIKSQIDNYDVIQAAREYASINHNIKTSSRNFISAIQELQSYFVNIDDKEISNNLPGEYI